MFDVIYTEGQQPCTNLKRQKGDIPHAPWVPNCHQCPKCEGRRTWCLNCRADHHEHGWETCKPGAYHESDE